MARGCIYHQTGCKTWTICYPIGNGKEKTESTHSRDYKVAQQILRSRLVEVDKGEWVERPKKPVRVQDLYDAMLTQPRGVEELPRRWKHLGPVFGSMLASAVTPPKVREYRQKRAQEGAAVATINRECAALKTMFNLGKKDGRIHFAVPYIQIEKEENARKGFVKDPQYMRLAAAAPELWLRALLATAYTFGFRKGELLQLRVSAVDLVERTIELYADETKSGKPRIIKMTAGSEVLALLTACISGKGPDDYVFTRGGWRANP